jgi:excisionase family DNA binding protein
LVSETKWLLSRREAAEALGVSVDTVANLISSAELKVVRIGKSVLVPRREIEGLIGRGTAKTRTPR